MSNFLFLRNEWPELYEPATKAENLALSDPRTACFYARRTLELAVQWLYKHDGSLRLPYQDNLSALLYEPTFKTLTGDPVFAKARAIKDLGNLAVHSRKVVNQYDAVVAVRELFHFSFWLARTYAKSAKPPDGTAFDQRFLPTTSPIPARTQEQLQKLEEQLAERDTRLTELLTGKAELDAELQRLRAEVADAKRRNEEIPDTHDYSEAETRDYFIDLLLKEAGWALDKPQDREYRVVEMPNDAGEGFVDYVLWGDDGKPLGLVEAKRTKRDARVGQRQAELYADCLEKEFGQRPVIFYSNGYDHWIWDDVSYPPRSVQGFYKKAELELIVQRRISRTALEDAPIDNAIVERPYQHRAIRRISEVFEKDHGRKALIVMATGAGKTRTVIALSDLLMRCHWVKRVLFLADRVALVNQAVGAFKRHLPASSPVNLVTEKDTDGRVYVSTYPTMMRLIDEAKDGQRKFGVGHFDLLIIDEAHRSVYQKYRAIFEYFDSLLVGLTATPKDEIDRNTYGLFDLETGVPTDNYGLDEAVKDHVLVPFEAVSVPLKFQREGIKYDELTEEEKDEWDALEWSDDGTVPRQVDPAAVNEWLFNKDTVDKVLEHVMMRGQKVAGGDRLGKTIVFAKNHDHAQFIAERFDANYPHYRGSFARVIDFQTEYVQSLIDSFSHPDKSPHIAVSVDMLDTGIDIPEIVNLVFFKLVRSKTKFYQMIGRGTRLRPELFGPGKDKQFFYIFDYCQNLEFFSQNPATVDGTAAASLAERLFVYRLELIDELEKVIITKEKQGDGNEEKELRGEIAGFLHEHVAHMNVNNFIVRPKRRLVEKYAEARAWDKLGPQEMGELSSEIAGLPSEQEDEDQDAKLFDALMLRLELALLRIDHSFIRLRKDVEKIARGLVEKDSIPMVRAQMPLIQEILTDDYWQDVNVVLLENARKRLRSLVQFIDKAERRVVYTDFEDHIGDEISVQLPIGAGMDFERFRMKARHFLQEHENEEPIRKLRWNEPLTASDLAELEKMLVDARAGTAEEIEKAKEDSHGFGLFLRSLIGLDRAAAQRAFAGFIDGTTMTANQLEFIDMIIEHLTQRGWVEPSLLYEMPFTDFNPLGVEGMFAPPQVTQLIAVLDTIRQRAAA